MIVFTLGRCSQTLGVSRVASRLLLVERKAKNLAQCRLMVELCRKVGQRVVEESSCFSHAARLISTSMNYEGKDKEALGDRLLVKTEEIDRSRLGPTILSRRSRAHQILISATRSSRQMCVIVLRRFYPPG